ncbi:glycosyltransferase family 2 protein [uncultured Draconibacterium sp.]|uniref:glycosyltransferase family 2 protein n=1 Tax=uncultured Draconibacterium sp. TaxID=1573823 RepID=UPI0029C830A2|nr:glycosyltransferase family 2 protein [uncultured Draconibacterium sp.]
MNNIKISIITITFNSEKTVEETINSVISQNYSNLEYILIDGGSTDRTLEIIHKYRDKISKIVSEKDDGISDAFNKGIKCATGDIIGIINSDDLLLPDALHHIAKNYTPEIDVYRGNTIIWNDRTGLKIREVPSMKFPVLHVFLNVSHQSTFISSKAYVKFGIYNENFRYIMDVDLLTRFYQHKAVFKYINADIALYRMGGVTNQSIRKKIPELKKYVLTNKGNYIQYILFIFSHAIIYYSKKAISIVNVDYARKMKLSLLNRTHSN